MACERTVAETVETLSERLQTSTLLEDRRDACRALRSLSKDFRVEVCAQAMEPIVQSLKHDRQDLEIVNYCLESLNYIISGENAELSAAVACEQISNSKVTDPGLELAEIFLKKLENVTIILEILEETDYKVRRTALRLICGLVRHKLASVQESILAFPLGVSTLVELLSENFEPIRTDAITLFVYITKDNPAIQKLVVFQNVFDKLIAIITTERYLEGGIVVEDCLIIFSNLLQSNESNKLAFRENSYIQKFMPFFNGLQEVVWDQQKIANMIMVLRILDTLLMVTNSPSLIQSCQTIMQKCGLLEKLCQLLGSSAIPMNALGVLSEAMNLASDIVRGQLGNSQFHSDMTMPSTAMTPVLLLSMMKELSQDQERRISELYNYVHSLHDFVSTSYAKQAVDRQQDYSTHNNHQPQTQSNNIGPLSVDNKDTMNRQTYNEYTTAPQQVHQYPHHHHQTNSINNHASSSSHSIPQSASTSIQQTSNYRPLLDQLDYSDPNII